MKISSREKKLLLFVILFLGVFAFYWWVYSPVESELKETRTQIENVETQYNLSKARLLEEARFDEEIKKSENLIKGYLENFYTQTLQEEFIIKIGEMCVDSEIFFGNTSYQSINSEYRDSKSTLDIKSYLEQGIAVENANQNKEEQKKKDDEFKEFTDSLNMTSTAFNFKGTYSQIWDFVKLLDVIDTNDKYVVVNTLNLSGKSEEEDGPAIFSKESGELCDASVVLHFYMTNDTVDYLNQEIEEE